MRFKQFLLEFSQENIYDLEDSIKAKLKLDKFSLVFIPASKTIILKLIIVNSKERSLGKGSEAMKLLCDYADKNNLKISIEPMEANKESGTTSKERLISFYKRFGFVSTSAKVMIRIPKANK